MNLPSTNICTCNQHKSKSVLNRAFQFDPTRTLGVRRRFIADLTRRFKAVQRRVTKAVVTNDALGLRAPRMPPTLRLVGRDALPKEFDFPRSQDKVAAFDTWLAEQIQAHILNPAEGVEIIEAPQLGEAVETAWTNKYIDSGYQQGIGRARSELIGAGFDVPTIAESGGINVVFNQPFHLDRVGLLYTRAFSELKTIASGLDSDVSSILAQGMAEGKNPITLAREMNKRLGIGLVNSKRIARTEIIRAHHMATIQEYRNSGVIGVKILAEFTTAGDSKVCKRCQRLAGKVFTLDKAEGIIPVHPNCRCVFLPLDVTDVKVSEAKVEAKVRGDEQRREIKRRIKRVEEGLPER